MSVAANHKELMVAQQVQDSNQLFALVDDPRCEYAQHTLKKSIFIHHFGRLHDVNYRHCDLLNKWGGECDTEMLSSEAVIFDREIRSCHIPRQVCSAEFTSA